MAVLLFQSTHPRRVRLCTPFFKLQTLSFNPRTHVGCDFMSATLDYSDLQFQSTHPRRVRQSEGFTGRLASVFQSTHPRRVRLWRVARGLLYSVFQSTHPRRVRHIAPFAINVLTCFNPRTHVGCDYALLWYAKIITGFNPRTHVGCDPISISALSL